MSTTLHDVAGRWDDLLERTGARTAFSVAADESAGDEPSAVREIDLRELFVRTDTIGDGPADLVGFVMTERERAVHELSVLESDALRTRSRRTADGVVVTDVRLRRAPADLRAVSLMLVKTPRHARIRDIVESIEDYGRILDYARDPEGSDAVAATALRRVAILLETDGVGVPLAGRLSGPGESWHRLLLARGEADGAEVRDGRLLTPRGDRPRAFREADFALVRFGPSRARAGELRSLQQLRREHSDTDAALDESIELPEEESYNVRVARARQSSRAEQIEKAAAVGDTAAAAGVLRTALAQPDDWLPLAENLRARVSSTAAYWAVDDVLAEVVDDPSAPDALRAAGSEVRDVFARRLDQLCNVVDSGAETDVIVVTPVILEVSDALVPFVDSQSDNGLFLFQLIPEMRDRILQGMGVRTPGIRARPDSTLPPGWYSLQVEEVPVWTSSVPFDIPMVVRRVTGTDFIGLSDVHPVTGERGVWQLAVADEDDPPESVLDLPRQLVFAVEDVLRDHLARWLYADDVRLLEEGWRGNGVGELLDAVVPEDGWERLAWLLQALAEDKVPITDMAAILSAVQAAGGLTAPHASLVASARLRLASRLPRWDATLELPLDLERGLADGGPGVTAPLELEQWLRAHLVETGPAATIVAATDGGRMALAAYARRRYRFVTTLTRAEHAAADVD